LDESLSLAGPYIGPDTPSFSHPPRLEDNEVDSSVCSGTKPAKSLSGYFSTTGSEYDTKDDKYVPPSPLCLKPQPLTHQ
jgi:hypothetical protein